METLSSKELRKTLNWLLELVTCPICLVTLEPSTVQCVNGHPICLSCRQDLQVQECPTCRSTFGNVGPTGLIRQIIEALPHPCRFKGCNKIVKTNDHHELYCRLRPTDCKLCDWVGFASNISKHVVDYHRPGFTLQQEATKSSWRFSLTFKEEKMHFQPLIVNNLFFWLQIIYDPPANSLTALIHHMAMEKVNSVYYAQISFKSRKNRYRAGIIINIDPAADPTCNCISIPTSVLPKYVGQHNQITYKFSIVMKKWESICSVVKSRLICITK